MGKYEVLKWDINGIKSVIERITPWAFIDDRPVMGKAAVLLRKEITGSVSACSCVVITR